MSIFDMSRANTESYYCYLRRQEAICEFIQIGAASFEIVGRLVEGYNGDLLMGGLVDCTKQPWAKGKRYPKASNKVVRSLNTFCNLMVLQSLSSFEYFLADLVADLCRFSFQARTVKSLSHRHTPFLQVISNGTPLQCCAKKAGKFFTNISLSVQIETLQAEFGLAHNEINELLPLFHYFRLMRNSIAHGDGYPSNSLLKNCASPEAAKSFSFWNKLSHKPTPEMFRPKAKTLMELEPHIAVLANAVCLRIANRLASAAVSRYTSEEMLEMATYYALIDSPSSFKSAKINSAPALVADYLYSRYRVKCIDKNGLKKGVDADTVRRLLKNRGYFEQATIQFTRQHP